MLKLFFLEIPLGPEPRQTTLQPRHWNLLKTKKKYAHHLFLSSIYIPYAHHYNPRFVYFLPTFWSPKTFFSRGFFLKTLALCMVSIQERVIVAHGRYLNPIMEVDLKAIYSKKLTRNMYICHFQNLEIFSKLRNN